uniref:Protein kinase domain-containing protein n=1 Tax=Heterorhabditis bacteriophora TaxID=37862 RepID=A0A1I7WBZ2_HETBA
MHEGENRGHSGIYGVHERPYPSKAVDNETNMNGSADVHTFLQHNNNKSYENMQSSQLPRAVQLLSQLSNSSSTFSRNFPTLPQTFNQSKSTDSLPDAGRRLPAIFTTPTSLLFPSTQMRRSFPSPLSIVTTPLRKVSSIRKPWSNKILSVSRKNSNKNQLYRSRKANRIFTGLFPIKKYGVMKPWKASFTKNTGISDSLYNNEMHFLSNTDKLTDIAIPYRNRATSFRTPVDKSSEIPKLLLVKQNVSRTVASYQPPIKILPKPRKFRPMSPEAIYEDIITQKQLVLSTKNAEYYQERNEDFEDFDSGFDKVEDSLVTFGENALPLPKKKSIKPMKHHIKSGGTGSDFDSKEMEAVINNSGTWTMEPVESGASDVIHVTERSKYFSSKNLSLPISSTTDDPLQGFTEEGKLSFSSIDSDGLQNGSDKGKDEYIDISADNHRPEIFYNKVNNNSNINAMIALESDIPPQPEYTLSADTRNIKAFPSDEKVVAATRYHNLPNRTLTQHTVVPRAFSYFTCSFIFILKYPYRLIKTRLNAYLQFNLTSCELYTSCLYNLEQQEKICNDTKREGRLMPGLPRRRVGLCNRQLVPHYLELDAGFRQLEADFRVCVQETMNTKTFQNLVISNRTDVVNQLSLRLHILPFL